MPPILTIFKLNSPYFDREFEYKHSKIISSSNKSIQNCKWNVINVSSKKKILCWRGVIATRDSRSYLTSKKKQEKISNKYSRISQSNGKFHGCWYIDCKCWTGKLIKKIGRQGSLYNKYSTSKPSRVEEEVEKYAYSNGTQAIVNCFKSKYPQCSFLHTSINSWKRKFNNQKEDFLPPIINKRGKPNLVRDDLLQR